MKKITAILFLLSFLPSFLVAQPVDYPISSFQRINQIIEELNNINNERENCLRELENMNNERAQELQERIEELKQREKELQELKRNLELWGNLIDDQAIYYSSLTKKLTFWRIFSLVLGTSTLTLGIITAAR